MKRALQDQIAQDLKKKAVFISGPRQSGKTTLARMLTSEHDYLNFDHPEHRISMQERSWDRSKSLVVLDELHKMDGWKAWLKGILDAEERPPSFLVTGSARLDDARKTGDSLAGRYFHYRLHPFDVREVAEFTDPQEALERILRVGGFPEPFLENNVHLYNRWRRTHLDVILRQDLIDLTSITDIRSIETLIELLRNRVGSPVSHASLARDLQRDPKTVRRWCGLLEHLYIIFSVTPWHRNIARAILKEPKYYFFDTGQVASGEGHRLENLVACSLLKEVHRLEDTGIAARASLHYIRNKEGREIDFAVARDAALTHLIEVKLAETSLSPNFAYFKTSQDIRCIQLLKTTPREKTFPGGEEIREAAGFLSRLDLSRR